MSRSPDELYGLPLDRFTPERDALAKELRAAKRRAEADAVKALRKPSAPAWAVNQLVRTQKAAVKELFAAGDAARAAQEDLIEGRGDRDALREATARQRDAVTELTRTARGLLSSEGHELSSATLDRVAETLNAAALDPDAREQVREGRLVKELRLSGLGAVAAPPGPRAAPGRAAAKKPAAKEKAAPTRKPAPPPPPKPDPGLAKAERAARKALDAARKRVEVMERKRAGAAEALAEVEEELASARAALAGAQRAHQDAVAAAEDA